MTAPARLVPLLAQFDFARERLRQRLAGPELDSGDGTPIPVPPLTDDEYRWEPVPGSWSIRPRSDGPAPGAARLIGAGAWGMDVGPAPWPPPFTTIAWRLGHLSEMLLLRADHTVGTRTSTRAEYTFTGDAGTAIAAYDRAATAWRDALISADDAALDEVGRSRYPYGSDAEEVFLDVVWWVNQELLHHGAELGLLRDLYRARHS